MKKFHQLFIRTFEMILLIGIVFYPLETFAADRIETSGLKLFREALSNSYNSTDKIFRQDVLFLSPIAQVKLEFLGLPEEKAFKISGDFDINLIEDNGTSDKNSIPFYIVGDNKSTTLYFKYDKDWQKSSTVAIAEDFSKIFSAPTEHDIDNAINLAKEITILQDTDERCTLRVKLDGNKMIELIKEELKKNPVENLNETDEGIFKILAGYFETAIRNADINFVWTIDKTDWRTIALQHNFSDVIQNLACEILNNKSYGLPDEFNKILEIIAYYSDIKIYTTYPMSVSDKVFEVPRKALKAKEVSNLFSMTEK